MDVDIDLVYATAANFTGARIYRRAALLSASGHRGAAGARSRLSHDALACA